MPDFFFFINEVLWGSIMIYLLLAAGIWFTLRSGFIQFRYIRKFGRSLKNSVTPQPGGLTSFQALCTSLAARLGSGNLAGVALAISAGGPGAVFWMWVTAIIGSSTAFIEATLAQLYKEKDPLYGGYRGGPAYYIHAYVEEKQKKKRNKVVISVLFAISGLICWCGIRVLYVTIAIRIIPVFRTISSAYPLTWTLSSIIFIVFLLRMDWDARV